MYCIFVHLAQISLYLDRFQVVLQVPVCCYFIFNFKKKYNQAKAYRDKTISSILKYTNDKLYRKAWPSKLEYRHDSKHLILTFFLNFNMDSTLGTFYKHVF